MFDVAIRLLYARASTWIFSSSRLSYNDSGEYVTRERSRPQKEKGHLVRVFMIKQKEVEKRRDDLRNRFNEALHAGNELINGAAKRARKTNTQ